MWEPAARVKSWNFIIVTDIYGVHTACRTLAREALSL